MDDTGAAEAISAAERPIVPPQAFNIVYQTIQFDASATVSRQCINCGDEKLQLRQQTAANCDKRRTLLVEDTPFTSYLLAEDSWLCRECGKFFTHCERTMRGQAIRGRPSGADQGI